MTPDQRIRLEILREAVIEARRAQACLAYLTVRARSAGIPAEVVELALS